MKWAYTEDNTEPIISAIRHINSRHGNKNTPNLPHTCVIFEIGIALKHLENNYKTKVLIERLPCFLDNPKCIAIDGIDDVCFTRGGYGAPAAVDTLETLLALGIKRIIIVGQCGGFSQSIEVGQVIIPRKILCEEGTSRHYFESIDFSTADAELQKRAVTYLKNDFVTHEGMTVTTDAVYRQTFFKEALWRKAGCLGVDMESSALLSVSEFYGIRAVSILLASDKHPLSEKNDHWDWGNIDFAAMKLKFIDKCIEFSTAI